MHHRHHKHNGGGYYRRTNKLAIIALIALSVLLALLFYITNQQDKKRAEELRILSEQIQEERRAKEAALKEKEANCSFYQKLQEGFDVSILVVGDSIGATNGASTKSMSWLGLLEQELRNKYGVKVSVTNVSMGGNSSYAGYVRTMMLDDGMTADRNQLQPTGERFEDYDLAIICYGQNDGEQDFSMYYESIIRAIRQKYSKCSIISILESSQRDYTNKMREIQNLCSHYDIPVADTIWAFSDSGKSYEELATDGVHPNDEGQKVYFQTVLSVIEQNIGTEYNFSEISVVNDAVKRFDDFLMVGTNQTISSQMNSTKLPGFTRADDTIYVVKLDALGMDKLSGIMGIYYTYQNGENKTAIYLDGQEYETREVKFDYDFSQTHIDVISTDCTVEDEIKIIFATKEQADTFQGVIFSGF